MVLISVIQLDFSAGFDKNVQLSPLMEDVGFGFASGGSVTLEPRRVI